MMSSKTIRAYVASRPIIAGSTVVADDLATIDIPANTPGPFIKSADLIVGNKVKNNLSAGEFFYPSSFMESWESYNNNESIPEDFIITSIQVPDVDAVGGLITPGDYVDIMGIPTGNKEAVPQYIAANVKIINTNSTLTRNKGNNDLSALVDKAAGGSGDGTYYILALSYDSVKKLRTFREVLGYKIFLNICPRQNASNEPLLEQMIGKYQGGLHNEDKPIMDKEGKMLPQEDIKQLYESPNNGIDSQSPSTGTSSTNSKNGEKIMDYVDKKTGGGLSN